MDLKDIKELINIIGESNLTTMELEQEGFKLVLKKESPAQGNQTFVPAGQVLPQGGYPTGYSGEGERSIMDKPVKPLHDYRTVKSPIVGTFYAAPSPDAEPFVQVGCNVKKGDILCIVEAMKLMNEIEAEEDFKIIDILVKDGEMVEYGQPLFVIE